MAEAQDVDTLKRRGRRRLVGAIALVLLAVIILPMVFDAEPRRAAPPVSVRIPAEEDTPFTPKVTPKSAPAPVAAAPSQEILKPEAAKPQAPKPEPIKGEPTKPEPTKPQSTAPETPKAQPPVKTQYMVPVGAFSNADSVIAKLAEAKLPYFTEPIATSKGKVLRVRAGPFGDKESADKAAETLKGLGFKPGNVIPRSG